MSVNNAPLTPLVPHKIKQPIIWTGLTGCADALAIASAVKQASRLFVVLTADTHTALRLEHEIAFFLDDENYPILHFPEWEILPYDVFSPLAEIVSERIKTLAKLPEVTQGVLVLSVASLRQRLAPRSYILDNSFELAVGGEFKVALNRLKLEALGYQQVEQVVEHAEFTLHDGIVDLFPMGNQYPFRLELDDEKIVSIRAFSAKTQLSIEAIESIQLYPAHEYPFTDEAIQRFRQGFREAFPEQYRNSPLYKDVSAGITPNGIESYLPLFVDNTDTLFDYLPATTAFVLPANLEACLQQCAEDVAERFELRGQDDERPLLAPDSLYLSAEDFSAELASFRRIYLEREPSDYAIWQTESRVLPDISIHAERDNAAQKLNNFLATTQSRVLFVAETNGHCEDLIAVLRAYKIYPKKLSTWNEFLNSDKATAIVVAALDHSLYLPDAGIAMITESQLKGDKVQQRRRRKTSATNELEKIVNNLNELTVGAAVVHQEHGVGRYLGLQVLQFSDIDAEFLSLEYAANAKLYVPVASLELIQRYTGMNADSIPLHKLGGEQWSKAKHKALEKIHDVAVELLDVHAKRALNKGHAFKSSKADYVAFANAFPFEETPDQQTAIEAIVEDMQRERPMDRVVCGDVGFGKTEVAMRASFIAVNGGKQVAILVPTTLLAQQHFQSFRDRFADWPVRVEVLSRFVKPKQQKAILADLVLGKVDIVIGTHKLLSTEMQYQALGLVIIDEEHRFGVKQKEYFKGIRESVDLLALTATPIPRTLNMAMAGVRDVSIIATPPANRHAIRTFVSEWVDSLVKEACQREIKRGGQMYFLHNNIQSMDKMARELERLVPEAKIEIAHGQMSEHELERIMLDFYHQRFNVLLCTTIIESGIDIPTANTIIINRADKLGLAALHQLRGRVGRSHHRAYAYFITPPKALISKDGLKRLDALESSAELGAGFLLATHDMEIRGAGELLGDGQSGQIQEIGFSLYTELLERAVEALKSGQQPSLDSLNRSATEIDLQTAALIPETYLPDIHLRLVLYKRIASAENKDALKALQIEMIDRFGLFPDAVKILFAVTALKQQATHLGVKKIEAHVEGGRVIFNKTPTINMDNMLMLIKEQGHVYRFQGAETLRFIRNFKTTDEKIDFIGELLTHLTE